MSKRVFVLAIVLASFAAGFMLRGMVQPVSSVSAQANHRVFEIRTYTAAPGRLDALKARFRDHTIAIFNKHGMTSIGYWTPQDSPQSQNTLIYILAHPSRETAQKNWDAFRNDPEWVKVKADSEANGPLTTKVESVFADPTDFSAMQ